MVPLPMKNFPQALPSPFVPVACGSSTTNSGTTSIIGSKTATSCTGTKYIYVYNMYICIYVYMYITRSN